MASVWLLLIAGSLFWPLPAKAEDWPQFLGPRADGTSLETGLLEKWGSNGPPVLWERSIGTGYSAPSVRGDRLVLHHRVANEEVVECFITPKALDHYFELQWNPLGGVFDAIITNHLDERGISKSFQGDWSFTAKNMKHAVKVKGTVGNSADKDEFWQVEVMIPFADLGLPAPKPGDTWRANFYRFNRTKGLPVEELSWSPTRLPGFHQPSRFGFLKFGE